MMQSMQLQLELCKAAYDVHFAKRGTAHLDIQHTINHQTDIVLGDCTLIGNGNCHFFQ